uniref:Uncharacterized protein n=1 Tax=Utricularia reniformis TaxID=192314 RepID=A0A1Y0B371_9LAMI|nr:hypothetical protein AEK19_MT1678 [Utricularia reniformis]ART31860.1 hypothetical protein AEK19_MT1678 [Utricularia reniformis]
MLAYATKESSKRLCDSGSRYKDFPNLSTTRPNTTCEQFEKKLSPICLQGIQYKIVAKILALTQGYVMPGLISESQPSLKGA